MYLAQPTYLVAFIHTVTAPSALRLLLPYLHPQENTRRRLKTVPR
jgi:hypothetical protein